MHVCTVLRYFLTVSTYCIYRTCLDKIQSASLGGQAGRQTDRQAGRQVLVLNVARLTLPLLAVAVAVAGPRFLAAHTHTHTHCTRCIAAPLHRCTVLPASARRCSTRRRLQHTGARLGASGSGLVATKTHLFCLAFQQQGPASALEVFLVRCLFVPL